MDLILWRHAEAQPGEPDADRELTVKGRKQAKRMAASLKNRLSGRYQILASPTARTRQTAMTLTADYDVSEDIGPAATARGIVKAAGWPDGKGTVIVVGHRPGLNRAAALLITGREHEWEMKRGGLWWLQLRDEGEPAFLRAVMGPKDA